MKCESLVCAETIFTVSVPYPTLSGFLNHNHSHKCPNMKTIAMQLVRVNCCLNSRNVSVWKCLLYHVLGLLYCLLLVWETHRYIWRSDFYLAFQERKIMVKAAHNYTMQIYTMVRINYISNKGIKITTEEYGGWQETVDISWQN